METDNIKDIDGSNNNKIKLITNKTSSKNFQLKALNIFKVIPLD